MAKKKLFDETIVSKKYNYTSPYSVLYYLYHDPSKSKRLRRPTNPAKEFKATELKGVCFSDLLREMGQQKGNKLRPNRVCYHMKEVSAVSVKLSTGEKESWVRMCKKHGMLPKYLPLVAINNGIFTIDVTDIPASLLYCYLSCFRHIREEPGFVRSMVYLVNKKKMDYYAAYILASSITISSGNKIHHPGEWCRGYLKDSGINSVKVAGHEIVRLIRYIEDPAKFDTRKIFNIGSNSWSCRTHIKKAFKETLPNYTGKQLLKAAVIKALKSKKPKIGLEKIKW